jgi:hypothetical protein
MPAILAAWEVKIERIMTQDQPRQTVLEAPISKITRGKMDLWLKWLKVCFATAKP